MSDLEVNINVDTIAAQKAINELEKRLNALKSSLTNLQKTDFDYINITNIRDSTKAINKLKIDTLKLLSSIEEKNITGYEKLKSQYKNFLSWVEGALTNFNSSINQGNEQALRGLEEYVDTTKKYINFINVLKNKEINYLKEVNEKRNENTVLIKQGEKESIKNQETLKKLPGIIKRAIPLAKELRVTLGDILKQHVKPVVETFSTTTANLPQNVVQENKEALSNQLEAQKEGLNVLRGQLRAYNNIVDRSIKAELYSKEYLKNLEEQGKILHAIGTKEFFKDNVKDFKEFLTISEIYQKELRKIDILSQQMDEKTPISNMRTILRTHMEGIKIFAERARLELLKIDLPTEELIKSKRLILSSIDDLISRTKDYKSSSIRTYKDTQGYLGAANHFTSELVNRMQELNLKTIAYNKSQEKINTNFEKSKINVKNFFKIWLEKIKKTIEKNKNLVDQIKNTVKEIKDPTIKRGFFKQAQETIDKIKQRIKLTKEDILFRKFALNEMKSKMREGIALSKEEFKIFKELQERKKKLFNNFGKHVRKIFKGIGRILRSFARSIRFRFQRLFRFLVGGLTLGFGLRFLFSIKRAEEAYASFRKELNRVATLVDITNKELESLGNYVLKLPAILGKPIDLMKAFAKAFTSGIQDITEAKQVVKVAAKLATTVGTDLVNTVDLLTTVLENYEITVDKAGDSLAKLIKVAKLSPIELSRSFGRVLALGGQLNLEFTEMSAALALLTRRGIHASQSVTYLTSFLNKLIRPTKEFTQFVRNELGRESVQALIEEGGGLLGILDIFKELPTRKISTFVNEIRGLIFAIAGTTKQGVKLNELIKEIEDSQGFLGKQVIKTQKEVIKWESIYQKLDVKLGKSMLRINTMINLVKATFMNFFADIIEENFGGYLSTWNTDVLVQQISILIGKFRMFFTIIERIGKTIMNMSKPLTILKETFILEDYNKLAERVVKIGNNITTFIRKIPIYFKLAISNLMIFYYKLEDLFDLLKTIMTTIFNFISFIPNIFKTFTGALEKTFANLNSMVTGNDEWLKDVLIMQSKQISNQDILNNKLKEQFKIQENLKKQLNNIITIFTGKDLKKTLKEIKEEVPTITPIVPGRIDFGFKDLTLEEYLPNLIKKLREVLPSETNKFWKVFKTYFIASYNKNINPKSSSSLFKILGEKIQTDVGTIISGRDAVLAGKTAKERGNIFLEIFLQSLNEFRRIATLKVGKETKDIASLYIRNILSIFYDTANEETLNQMKQHPFLSTFLLTFEESINYTVSKLNEDTDKSAGAIEEAARNIMNKIISFYKIQGISVKQALWALNKSLSETGLDINQRIINFKRFFKLMKNTFNDRTSLQAFESFKSILENSSLSTVELLKNLEEGIKLSNIGIKDALEEFEKIWERDPGMSLSEKINKLLTVTKKGPEDIRALLNFIKKEAKTIGLSESTIIDVQEKVIEKLQENLRKTLKSREKTKFERLIMSPAGAFEETKIEMKLKAEDFINTLTIVNGKVVQVFESFEFGTTDSMENLKKLQTEISAIGKEDIKDLKGDELIAKQEEWRNRIIKTIGTIKNAKEESKEWADAYNKALEEVTLKSGISLELLKNLTKLTKKELKEIPLENIRFAITEIVKVISNIPDTTLSFNEIAEKFAEIKNEWERLPGAMQQYIPEPEIPEIIEELRKDGFINFKGSEEAAEKFFKRLTELYLKFSKKIKDPAVAFGKAIVQAINESTTEALDSIGKNEFKGLKKFRDFLKNIIKPLADAGKKFTKAFKTFLVDIPKQNIEKNIYLIDKWEKEELARIDAYYDSIEESTQEHYDNLDKIKEDAFNKDMQRLEKRNLNEQERNLLRERLTFETENALADIKAEIANTEDERRHLELEKSMESINETRHLREQNVNNFIYTSQQIEYLKRYYEKRQEKQEDKRQKKQKKKDDAREKEKAAIQEAAAKRREKQRRRLFEIEKEAAIATAIVNYTTGLINVGVSFTTALAAALAKDAATTGTPGVIIGALAIPAIATALSGLAMTAAFAGQIAEIQNREFLPALATGGKVLNSGFAKINEEGAEIRRLNTGEMIFPAELSENFAKNVENRIINEKTNNLEITNNFYVTSNEPEEIYQYVVTRLEEQIA